MNFLRFPPPPSEPEAMQRDGRLWKALATVFVGNHMHVVAAYEIKALRGADMDVDAEAAMREQMPSCYNLVRHMPVEVLNSHAFRFTGVGRRIMFNVETPDVYYTIH